MVTAKPKLSSVPPWWAWSDRPQLTELEGREEEEGEEREVGAAA